jgi:hypothetical protein
MGLAKETMIAEVEAFIAELRKSQKDKIDDKSLCERNEQDIITLQGIVDKYRDNTKNPPESSGGFL